MTASRPWSSVPWTSHGCTRGWWAMSDFYEPWEPRVGDYVEITPGPECQIQGTPNSPQSRLGITRGHAAWETGRRGYVREIRMSEDDPHGLVRQGHRFLVRWDEAFTLGDRPIFGASYAA